MVQRAGTYHNRIIGEKEERRFCHVKSENFPNKKKEREMTYLGETFI